MPFFYFVESTLACQFVPLPIPSLRVTNDKTQQDRLGLRIDFLLFVIGWY
jgi:hypothetical protein